MSKQRKNLRKRGAQPRNYVKKSLNINLKLNNFKRKTKLQISQFQTARVNNQPLVKVDQIAKRKAKPKCSLKKLKHQRAKIRNYKLKLNLYKQQRKNQLRDCLLDSTKICKNYKLKLNRRTKNMQKKRGDLAHRQMN